MQKRWGFEKKKKKSTILNPLIKFENLKKLKFLTFSLILSSRLKLLLFQ